MTERISPVDELAFAMVIGPMAGILFGFEVAKAVNRRADGITADARARLVLENVAREEAEAEARIAAAAKSLAEYVHGMFAAAKRGEPTPDCDCESCTAKRAEIQKAGN